jgi:predicted GIY-YIG superfamily endonuclease
MGMATAWTIYIVECADGTLYTGITNDLAARLAAHNRGTGARYTRSRRPVKLVYKRKAPGRGAATKREAAIKRLTRQEKLKMIARARPSGGASHNRGQGPGAEPHSTSGAR